VGVDVDGLVNYIVEGVEARAAVHKLDLDIVLETLSKHSYKSLVILFCEQ
jgi:hypothetical protein